MLAYVRFLLVALIGSLAIYYAVPAHSGTNLCESAGLASTETEAPDGVALTRRPVKENGLSEDSSDGVGREEAALAASAGAVVSEAPAPAEEPREPEVIVETVIDYKPSTDVIRQSGNDVTHWGVVVRDAPLYDKQGAVLDANAPAGTLIEQIRTAKTTKGMASYCRMWRSDAWSSPVVILSADIICFEGTRRQIAADDVGKICSYYQLVAAHTARQKELTRAMASKNPYYDALTEKTQNYNRNADKAAELVKARDEAKGWKRQSYIKELDKLKQSEARDAAEIRKLKKKYEDWKESHPAETDLISQDRQCAELMRKINKLQAELSGFGI